MQLEQNLLELGYKHRLLNSTWWLKITWWKKSSKGPLITARTRIEILFQSSTNRVSKSPPPEPPGRSLLDHQDLRDQSPDHRQGKPIGLSPKAFPPEAANGSLGSIGPPRGAKVAALSGLVLRMKADHRIHQDLQDQNLWASWTKISWTSKTKIIRATRTKISWASRTKVSWTTRTKVSGPPGPKISWTSRTKISWTSQDQNLLDLPDQNLLDLPDQNLLDRLDQEDLLQTHHLQLLLTKDLLRTLLVVEEFQQQQQLLPLLLQEINRRPMQFQKPLLQLRLVQV